MTYPRNQAVRNYMSRQGFEVVVIPRQDRRLFLIAWAGLVVRALKYRGPFDIVILSEFSIQYAVSAKLISLRFGCPLIIDAFVGLHESIVGDWETVRPSSIRAIGLFAVDRLAACLANFLLIDTNIRRQALLERTRTPVLTLPVGAPTWAQPEPPSCRGNGRIRVLYYGNYIPLHGLQYVMDNIKALKNRERFEFVFVGNGSLRPGIEAQVDELEMENVISFCDAVEVDELVREIYAANVVLGVFGESPKASSVLANKVWQGLACGRLVVTRKSEALRELGMLPSNQVLAVDIEKRFDLARVLEFVADQYGSEGPYFPESRALLCKYVESQFDRIAGLID